MDPIPAQANIRTAALIAVENGAPITTGTVNLYVRASTGTNAGKWFQGSDDTWQASEAIAGAMTHVADGHWEASIAAAAWIDGVEYLEYAKESGDLHVPVSWPVRCRYPATDAAGVRTALGLAAANLDTQLGAIGALIAGTGTGARTVTLTVTDGTDPLENARVRVTAGAESYVRSTNASGVVVFSLDDATWDVVITLQGYTFTATTLVVDGNETATYAMTQEEFPESEPGGVTGYLDCFDENEVAEEGVVITVRKIATGAATGEAFDWAYRVEKSNSAGRVYFVNMRPGSQYQWSRGPIATHQHWHRVTIAADAVGRVKLTSGGGADE